MSRLEIRLATDLDTNRIRKFIKVYWTKKNHIFFRDKNFFNFEMCRYNKPSFIIALENSKLIGILGFTYNRDIIQNSDLFLVMFRVRKSKKNPNVGIKLLEFANKLTNKSINTIGADEKILTYYKFLGFHVGYLNHYYWLNKNPAVRKYFYRKFSNIKTIQTNLNKINNHQLIRINKKNLKRNLNTDTEHKLLKSKNFFYYRYAVHPIYDYIFFKSSNFKGVGVVRAVKVGKFLGWKIIDWYGDLKNFPKFCKLLIENGEKNYISFIDLYCSGISEDKFNNTGLQKINENVIIPNYFEPLVFKNIKISFASNKKGEKFFIRGDGDQDRPS